MRLCKICSEPAVKQRLLCLVHMRQEHREFVRKTRVKGYAAKRRWNKSVSLEISKLFPSYQCPLKDVGLFAIGTFRESRQDIS